MWEPDEDSYCWLLRQTLIVRLHDKASVQQSVLPPVSVKINRVMSTAQRCASTSLLPSDQERYNVCVSQPITKRLCQAIKKGRFPE